MATKKEYKAAFIGKHTFYAALVREEEGNIMIQTKGLIKKWRPVVGNLKEQMLAYKEKSLYDPDKGRTETKVKIFPFDIDTFEQNFEAMNAEAQVELQTIIKERDYYLNQCMRLDNMLKQAGIEGMLKKQTKANHEFYTGLKPPFFGTNKEDKKK